MTDLKDVFVSIAETNKWRDGESVSGAGSTAGYTHTIRHELAEFVRAFEMRSLFDAPCGDFNWMRFVEFPQGFAYIGGEIVPALVQTNSVKYGGEGRRFVEFDIARDVFPEADLWMCRDCLFHLSYARIFAALEGFCRSSIGYLMTTTHLNTTGFVNRDIVDGDYRPIDLYSEPFNLPREALYQIPDYVFPYPQREMVVWSRAQVEAALALRR